MVKKHQILLTRQKIPPPYAFAGSAAKELLSVNTPLVVLYSGKYNVSTIFGPFSAGRPSFRQTKTLRVPFPQQLAGSVTLQ